MTARVAIITTNRINSRWRVVILVRSAEDSLAIIPLRFRGKCKTSIHVIGYEFLQDSSISSLKDKPNT